MRFTITTPMVRGGILGRVVLYSLVVLVWATVHTWMYPLPTQTGARRKLDVIMAQRHLEHLTGKADPAHRRQLAAAVDSLKAIRFDSIQVRRPLLDWILGGTGYVIRTLETDPGEAPRMRYYHGGWASPIYYETSKRVWWLGL